MAKRLIVLCLFVLTAVAQSGANGEDSWGPPATGMTKEKAWTKLGTFESSTIGHTVGYFLYLPPDYDASTDRRYPVIYWLHGRGGGPEAANSVVKALDAAIRTNAAPTMILIGCADPIKQSMWTDSKDGKYPVETVIVEDLIPHVDSTYRTIARREGRAIEGFSMGAFGDARLGCKLPDQFGVVSIMATAMPKPEDLQTRWKEHLLQGYYRFHGRTRQGTLIHADLH